MHFAFIYKKAILYNYLHYQLSTIDPMMSSLLDNMEICTCNKVRTAVGHVIRVHSIFLVILKCI